MNSPPSNALNPTKTADDFRSGVPARPSTINADIETIALIELLFFAYRDFVAEPDQVLQHYGFGRAHHRVLHFVNRNPGLTVAELLDILKITKQSLARVLRQLVDEGFVVQKTGEADRRQRHLFLSPAGTDLANKLLALQIARVGKAHAATIGLGLDEADAAFLRGLIDAGERDKVLSRINAGKAGGTDRT
jgi:DNA-binding MarR family transcriptional regulator